MSILGSLDLNDVFIVPFLKEPTLSTGIAAGAGGIVVLGALAVALLLTVKGWWKPLWSEWLTSLDHKKIGVMYVVLAAIMLIRGVLEAVVMRAQQVSPAPGFLSVEHHAELFSTHGTIMIFFVAMPFLTGVINVVMPLQIGARDMEFPFMNAVSLWLSVGGAALVMASLVVGHFETGGWTAYPPYTGIKLSPNEGVDYWIWSLALTSVGTTLSGINFAVTIYKQRAPGMDLMKMPIFAWTTLCTAILMIFAMMPLTVASFMLALDRHAGFHFFTASNGGNMMNFANMFWLFGHPEVYILILPAFGVFSHVIPTFSGKKLYGYTSLVWATIAIAVLSFTVWVHHFFTMGQTANLNAIFGIATMTIGVPTGVKVFNWLLTMWRGKLRFSTAMLFSAGFMFTFVIGGITGVMLANPTIDFATHNSLFLVAHFHNMLIPGLLFGMFAAVNYWFPLAFGFRLDETWGRRSFWFWMIGFYLAFMPLYAIGLMGAPRRMAFFTDPAYFPWLVVAMIGALCVLAGLTSQVIQIWVSVKNRESLMVPAGDPWDGRGLEWSLGCPVPEYDFTTVPHITSREPWVDAKAAGKRVMDPTEFVDIHLPKPTGMPILVAGVATVGAFALIFEMWLIAAVCFVAMWVLVLIRSYDTDWEETITAEELREGYEAHKRLVETTPKVSLDDEFTSKNRGLILEEAV
ncbi:MAG: cbb3-type cytochrome c oxidase subunit I [Thioclava marina]|uniref:cbb3-type cytochrome c oxidase subunit I n=1 Tax=Thioclava marina TaxID=1915077 RepID=UPI00099643D5|nr:MULTISPECIES: cbb3-type cytochrome c oxidase subunit I [Thioclava]MBC7146130.1 cbb3-type cytochrome c oxidase subunit I [Thioclava marina]MBD3802722.1 cbb3-type cytochrome c oxidase subunit I [Thioclava sp.]TNF13674.1 MAG: cytochrome ubiquinol oxidase subunit I [Paracoccaceae bacterium]